MALKPAQLYMYADGAVMVPLNIPGVPKTVAYGGATYHRKAEFHTTCFYTKRVLPEMIAKVGDETAVIEQVREVLQRQAARASIGSITFTGELRTARHQDQRSIVVMCEVEGLRTFYDAVNPELPIAVEYPPTHVTLFTIPQHDPGIPLLGQAQLAERTQLIPDEELAAVRSLIATL